MLTAMVVFSFEAVYNVIDSFLVLNVGPNILCMGLNICIHDLYQVVRLKQNVVKSVLEFGSTIAFVLTFII